MTTTVHSVVPRAFDAVGGFLGQRFSANHEKRLGDALLPQVFIRFHRNPLPGMELYYTKGGGEGLRQ